MRCAFLFNSKLCENSTIYVVILWYLCVKGQQVGVYPDHSSNNEAAEIQRGCCCCGHQELAHGAGHRWIIYSTHWCSRVYVLMLPPKRRILSEERTCSVHPPDDLPRKKSPQMYKPPTPEMLAYLDFSVSTTGILAGVKVCWMLKDTWIIWVLIRV